MEKIIDSLDFIYNPLAGGKKALKAIKLITERLTAEKILFSTHKTEGPKHAIQIAKELSNGGAKNIIAVGGDGTMNEVLNGINPKTVNFGIIPAGSGNDFAACAKIPTDFNAALDLILKNEPKPTDYMDCSGVRGINIIGTGIDVDILKRCASSKFFKGKLQYTLSLIISLLKFKFYNFGLETDGKRIDKEALILCAANGRQQGGGIRMCPTAEIDDGKIDFLVVDKMKKSKIIGALLKLLKGKILDIPQAKLIQTTEINAYLEKNTTVQVDGELYFDLPFKIKLIHNGVNLFRP